MSKNYISRKENLKKCTSFEEQKGTRYIRGSVCFAIIVFSCLLSAKPCPRFGLIYSAWEMKDFYQSSLGNEVNFRDILNISPKILAKHLYFKKLRDSFVGERPFITTTLISSCHWKTFVAFCLRKKRPENAFLTLTVTYRKIVQRNKLCHPKQQQIYYLVIYHVIYLLLLLI